MLCVGCTAGSRCAAPTWSHTAADRAKDFANWKKCRSYGSHVFVSSTVRPRFACALASGVRTKKAPTKSRGLTKKLASQPLTYSSEAELTQLALITLASGTTRWGRLQLAREFFYVRGCTDIIALSSGNHVIAFEAKLTRWRTALDQAHRNRCFAHESYVLLPETTARRAAEHIAEFEHRGVGLCYLGSESIVCTYIAHQHDPWQQWLAERAIGAISECNGIA